MITRTVQWVETEEYTSENNVRPWGYGLEYVDVFFGVI